MTQILRLEERRSAASILLILQFLILHHLLALGWRNHFIIIFIEALTVVGDFLAEFAGSRFAGATSGFTFAGSGLGRLVATGTVAYFVGLAAYLLEMLAMRGGQSKFPKKRAEGSGIWRDQLIIMKTMALKWLRLA